MTQKFSAARKRAFLTYLEQSGNQTLSAERAKVSRSWVRLHRSTDPQFDADCREAIAVAKMMLTDEVACPPLAAPACRRGNRPDNANWRYHDGHELVVSGTNGRRTQVRRARVRQWSPKVEDRFLALLSATGNVKLACREVGLAFSSAYAHRKRWPGFARRWDQAIEIGMCELQSALIENACYFLNPEDAPLPEQMLEGMSVEHAIDIARMNWGKARGLRRREEGKD